MNRETGHGEVECLGNCVLANGNSGAWTQAALVQALTHHTTCGVSTRPKWNCKYGLQRVCVASMVGDVTRDVAPGPVRPEPE